MFSPTNEINQNNCEHATHLNIAIVRIRRRAVNTATALSIPSKCCLLEELEGKYNPSASVVWLRFKPDQFKNDFTSCEKSFWWIFMVRVNILHNEIKINLSSKQFLNC